MQKTKLGISVGLLGAIVYLFGMLTGLSVVTVLAVAYILLCEEHAIVRKAAVRTVVLLIVFNLVYFVVGLIPDALGFLASLIRVFDSYEASEFASSDFVRALENLQGSFNSVVSFVSDAIFVLLGILALAKKDVNVPVVDKFVA